MKRNTRIIAAAKAASKTAKTTTPPPSAPRPMAVGVRVHPNTDQLKAMFSTIKVNANGCWLWTNPRTGGPGPVTDKGLPKFAFCPPGPARLTIPGKFEIDPVTKARTPVPITVPMAHRTSWAWFRGLLLPYPNWKIVQTCGVLRCINPAHLRQVRVPQVGELATFTTDTAVQPGKQRLLSIFEHITRVEKTGCWYWRGAINASGYGMLRCDDNSVRSVDALLFDWFVGYPDGQAAHDVQLFHDCMSRPCVNPAHMQPVKYGERAELDRQRRDEMRCLTTGHRWARPVALGDRCYCGAREADEAEVTAIHIEEGVPK